MMKTTQPAALDVDALRLDFVDHLKGRPEMPRPFDPFSDAAKGFQAALFFWAKLRDRLEYMIQSGAVIAAVREGFVRTSPGSPIESIPIVSSRRRVA